MSVPLDDEPRSGTPVDLSELKDLPERVFDLSVTEMYSLPATEVAEYQLCGVRKRFAALAPRIPVLAKLAAEQSVDSIRTLDDGARLLFQHSVYKSYPQSFIEKNQFDRMTKWLANLTSHDLSGLDTRDCTTIDDWIERLDARTQLRVMHSTGTSGKLSFIPMSTLELPIKAKAMRAYFQGYRGEPNEDVSAFADAPTIYLNYRSGAMGHHRVVDALRDMLYDGDESKVFALFPGRMSADVMSLGGRLAAAASQGERGRVQLSEKLIDRRERFLAEQANITEHTRKFFETVGAQLHGKQVALYGSVAQVLDLAESGSRGMFHPDSFVQVGGGGKGRALPPDWKDRIRNFLGVPTFKQGYGMTETCIGLPPCPEGALHIPPAIVPYLLDAKSGAVGPRTGTHKGRLGLIDLTAQSLWGGFLTSDEVTITWGDSTCACGRIGARIHDNIRRYTPEEGGDDKITCAGAPQAHENALAFLASRLE